MIDTQTVDTPAVPKNAKPSELLRSLAEDHWNTYYLKRVMKEGYVWCAVGWILECAGVTWRKDDVIVSMLYPLRADGRPMVPCEAAALCGLTQEQYLEVVTVNDRDGREAVIHYLESIGK